MKTYRFYLKDEKDKVLVVHDSHTASVAFKTHPGKYHYNVTAIYSGGVESAPSDFQPELHISGRKLETPKVTSTAAEEKNHLFKVKTDPQVFTMCKVEYSAYAERPMGASEAMKKSTKHFPLSKSPVPAGTASVFAPLWKALSIPIRCTANLK